VNVLTGFVFDATENRDSSSRLKKFSLITQLKPPGECWAINFYRDQKVSLDAEWKVRFDFSFDGKPTKVIPPAELNIN
jgi:LPS-assembly protein